MEMWGVGAAGPKINVRSHFCSERIQDNAKHVTLAFKYFYSPTRSLAVLVGMSSNFSLLVEVCLILPSREFS